uniref:Uncharacterized protein n=1 Tax=Sinocyclocheilus rhinocerous TaxID=307959 RepID=A0A673K2J3_9TELE
MIRSLSLLKYSLNVSQRAHISLLSSSRGVGKRITCAAGVSVAHRRYSTQQAESTEEETLHTIISDTENVQGKPNVLKLQVYV